jgi:hypothetical protein
MSSVREYVVRNYYIKRGYFNVLKRLLQHFGEKEERRLNPMKQLTFIRLGIGRG